MSLLPMAIARDFITLILALVACSYLRRMSSNLYMSSTLVKKMVTSSAYAMIAVLDCLLPIFMPLMLLSICYITGFGHSENKIILNGYPV